MPYRPTMCDSCPNYGRVDSASMEESGAPGGGHCPFQVELLVLGLVCVDPISFSGALLLLARLPRSALIYIYKLQNGTSVLSVSPCRSL